MKTPSVPLALALALSLTSCDGWFGTGQADIDGFSASPLPHSLAVDLTWELSDAPMDGLRCRLHPGEGLAAVELPHCAHSKAAFHLYPAAGSYQAKLRIVGDTPEVIAEASVDIELAPLSVEALRVHMAIPASVQFEQINLLLRPDGPEAGEAAKHPFTATEEGPLVAEAPIANGDARLHLSVVASPKGDPKSEWEILESALVPNRFGSEVWILPGLSEGLDVGEPQTLFHSAAQIGVMLEILGSASRATDDSTVNATADTHWNPHWTDSANFMEIYVRGYQDSDGDGIGDLNGLISRLPYLEELGITALWLMPITESSDNDHGYSVRDYRSIESDYGDLADFQRLLEEAHQRGIAIIIDYVINHSSDALPIFVEAASSPQSARRDWYIWSEQAPEGWLTWGHYPWRPNQSGWYYGPFSNIMPDFNLRKAEVIEFHINNLRHWLNLGVDGFRFDAVGMLIENGAEHWEDQPENQQVLKRMHDEVHNYPGRYTVCESGSAFEKYANKDSCGNSFNFIANEAIIEGVKTGRFTPAFVEQLGKPDFPNTPLILSNHDSFAGTRVWDQLDGDEELYRLAAQTYLLSARHAFTYYGEEIGISTGDEPIADHTLRVPMSWTGEPPGVGFSQARPFRNLAGNHSTHNVATELQQPDSLYHHYRQLYWLRKLNPVVSAPQIKVLSQPGDDHLLLMRANPQHRAVIAINYASEPRPLTLETGLGETTFQASYGEHSDTETDAAGLLELTAPPRDAIVLISR